MNKWEQVRRKARAFHAEICSEIKSSDGEETEISAELLLETAARLRGIELKGYPANNPWLKGAWARCTGDKIIYNRDVERWLQFYYQAHEFGHIELIHGARECTAEDINCEASESKIQLGVHRVEGYGPHERIECEANIFAREFLLPCDKLRRWFIEDGLNAEQIADKTGMGLEMVFHQLAYALLTPEISPDGESQNQDSNKTELKLDDFQKDAARVPEGPQMLEAGPGTGKTRTLIGRALHLLANKVKAENILILTFSNKAAEELRQRVKRFAPDELNLIRVETFHSFGLELLRKYGTEIGLSSKPVILDPIDALFLLERFLPELELDYYQNLYDPALYLGDILKAISRAKDENVNPARYRKLAQLQADCATSDEEKTAAAKVLEVAGVYEFYDKYLRTNKLLDFGDLICRSIELLSQHPKIRSKIRALHQHILVDEYQDVNRASGLLLKELAGDGFGLWAVGDIRQSIHRWRGATTANIRQFKEDFKLAKDTLSLKINYRSKPEIVDVFSTYAPTMKAVLADGFHAWEKNRTNEGVTVKFEIATDQETEAVGIAREILCLQKEGVPFKQQAIICRSHTTLARIAKILEREDVPVLYLGDFFERPEVRDMLSLLSFACEANGRGLVRVARFPEYDIPLEVVRHLHRLAKEKKVSFPQALELAKDSAEISAVGKEKIALVESHLEDLCHGRSAWKTLTRYLFVKSHYLQPFLADQTVKGQQQRLALYQLLQFAHNQLGAQTEAGIDPKKSLLKYIRRLEMYGDEKQLRQSSEWADGIDAVRISTIHASKGLEFTAVFLPALSSLYFPTNPNRYESCPPPIGLITEQNNDWKAEEEECLFFVALSRARDYICISHALRYGKVTRKASSFIEQIAGKIPANGNKITWDETGKSNANDAENLVPPPYKIPEIFDVRELEVYLDCPRKYLYEFILGLSGKRDDTAYLQFHKCVHDAVRQVKEEHKKGIPATNDTAQKYLDEAWEERGPKEHFLEKIYKDAARKMVSNAVRRIRDAAKLVSNDLEITLPAGKISLSLDHAEVSDINDAGSKIVFLQRFRTGRPSKKEKDKPIYGLILKAVSDIYPNSEPRLQILYLGADFAEDVPLTVQKISNRVEKYNNAILKIKNAEFTPTPDDHECPRCPHFHICPAAEDSAQNNVPTAF